MVGFREGSCFGVTDPSRLRGFDEPRMVLPPPDPSALKCRVRIGYQEEKFTITSHAKKDGVLTLKGIMTKPGEPDSELEFKIPVIQRDVRPFKDPKYGWVLASDTSMDAWIAGKDFPDNHVLLEPF